MRIRFAAVLALIAAAWMVVPMTPAQADPERASRDCTIIGTPGPDVLRGTRHDDFICGLGGDDKILGRGGDDVLQGGGGDDLLVGGPGDDVLGGGRGDDTLNGLDNATAIDRLRCGRGKDEAKADVPDVVRRSCEKVEQDDAPTDLSLAPASVAENQPGGTAVGTLSAADPDPGDSHTFTLVAGTGSTDNGSFTIVGATLRTAVSLDFETTPTQSVRIRATDSGGLSIEKAFTITVTDADDPPVAVDDTETVVEDDPATAIDVLANDTDTDGGPKNIASVTQPTNGTVVITGGGSGLTYEPDANYCNGGSPTDDFTYTLNGGDVGAVAVTVTCVNDLAVAGDDSATVGEDSTNNVINVLANDTDVEGDPFSVIAVTQPAANATVTFTPADVSYTPDANYCNNPPPFSTFTYTVTGGDVATVSVTVTCVNDAPVAVDDTKAATEDTPLTFPAADLTANDTDPDVGDTLTVTAVSNPSGGTVSLAAGSVTFTPAANVCGAAAGGFDYTLSDGTATDTGHVTVNIACVNDTPDAVNDTETVAEDSGATTFDVLANDTDAENDPITVTGVTQPANGGVTFTANDVSYTPNPNYCNTPTPPFDTFTYTVNGGDSATVSITVTCANDAPVVDLDSTTVGNDSVATFNETNPHTGTGVLIAPNATVTDIDDANIESLTVVLTTRPDGDAFESLSATLSAGITGSYDPATGTLALTGSAAKAAYAAVIASIRYDNTQNPPNPANRTITVVVNDGGTNSVVRNAIVGVVPLNVAPDLDLDTGTAGNDSTASFVENGPAVTLAPAPAIIDTDDTDMEGAVVVLTTRPDGNGQESLTFTPVGGISAGAGYDPATGTLTFTGTSSKASYATLLGSIQYANTSDTPTTTARSVTFKVNDGLADSIVRAATVSVVAANDAPTATNLSAAESYTEDTPLNLINIVVSDADSANVTVTLTLSNPAAGSLSVGTSGSVTSTYVAGTGVWAASGAIADVNTLLAGVVFTPAPNFNAGFTIASSVTDGIAAPVTGSKAMTGTPVNDAPVNNVPGAQVVDEDTDLVFTAGNLLIVSDVDGGPLTIQVTVTNGTFTLSGTAGLSGVTGNGTASVSATGSVANLNTALNGSKYRGTLNYNGPAQLTLNTADGSLSDNDVVAITVNPVNDAPVADDETFNGSNSAIGNTTLVVDDPTDGVPSATGPTKTITGDILAGDTDVDGDTLSVVPGTVTSGGGTVVIQADGDFTLLPPAGCATPYSFDYTVTDGGSPALTDTGTVTVAVTECVWYVDPAAAAGGDGRSNAPFQTLTGLNGAGGVGDVDDDSDFLFLASGSSFNTGLVLESNQRLFGGSHGLTVASTTLVTAGGANPTIGNPSGNGLTLSSGNTIQGINLGNTPAGSAALAGTTVGTATMDTVTPGTINNTTGGAVDISGGTLAMSFTSVTSTNATNDGIRLDNTAGTFTASGGSLSNAGGQDVDLSGNNLGDSVDFTFNGTIADATGQAVSIAGQSGGTKDFNGAIGTAATPAGRIVLTSNGGATISFDGGVVLSTGATVAFSASGGGTVSVSDPNANGTAPDNALTTTSATALNVVSTTIGASGLTFRSISSSGAPNGIVLNATGGSAGLEVTGDGGGSSNGSGGTIAGSTGIGVSLTSTTDVDLGYLNVTGSADAGIKGISVTGFRLNRSNVNSNGNSTSDEGIQFGEFSGSTVGVTGTVSILNSSVSGNAHNNVHVRNTSGTISSFTVTDSSFNNLNDVTGANSFLFEASGTSVTTTATISGSTFQNNSPQRALEVQVHDTGTIGSGANAFTVSGNTFVDNGIHASFTQDTAGNLQFKFQNNGTAGTPMTGSQLQAVNVFSSSQSTGGTLVGTISGNFIGNAAVANSGSTQGGAISAVIQGQTDATLLIDSNTTRQTNGDSRAIGVALRGAANPLAGTLGANTVVSDVTITNNNVVPGAAPSGFPLAAIVIEADNQTGADNKSPTVRADVRGNTVPSTAVFDLLTAQLIFYEYTSPGSHGIAQLVDSPPGSATATAQLQSTNTGTAEAGAGSADVALIAGPIGTPP